MSYKVRLRTFEGPFDLLVYLIENAQMNIYDIQISEITGQYLDYIKTMREMDFNVGTEFMVLAATLIDIKSRMILPRSGIEGTATAEEDPRSDLVERLLEYKRFKKGAEILSEREDYMTLVYEKPQEDISAYLEQPDEYLSLDIRQFAEAFELFLQKKKREEAVRAHYTRIERDKATMEGRMLYIRDRVRSAFTKGVRRLNLKELIPDKKDRYDIVVTFSSVLQMMRDKYLDAEQKQIYGDIIVMPAEKSLEEAAETAESLETAVMEKTMDSPGTSESPENSEVEKPTETSEALAVGKPTKTPESSEEDGTKSGLPEQAMRESHPKPVTAGNSQGEKETESEETRK